MCYTVTCSAQSRTRFAPGMQVAEVEQVKALVRAQEHLKHMRRKELMTPLVSVSAMPTNHARSEAVRPSAELAALLPPGWALDFPLARVRTCGALVVEVLLNLE